MLLLVSGYCSYHTNVGPCDNDSSLDESSLLFGCLIFGIYLNLLSRKFVVLYDSTRLYDAGCIIHYYYIIKNLNL